MLERPKTLRCADAVAEAEGVILAALPDIVAGLVERAKAGDTKAALYLVDRILGKTAGSKAAPADDRALPFTDADFRSAVRHRELMDSIVESFEGRGPDDQATDADGKPLDP